MNNKPSTHNGLRNLFNYEYAVELKKSKLKLSVDR